jgi:hypothetical protein
MDIVMAWHRRKQTGDKKHKTYFSGWKYQVLIALSSFYSKINSIVQPGMQMNNTFIYGNLKNLSFIIDFKCINKNKQFEKKPYDINISTKKLDCSLTQ